MRRSASIALACAAGAAAILPAAAPANAGLVPSFGLVAPLLAPMLPGQSGWVSTLWGAAADVCNVKVTAAGAGVNITYPTNTSTYSSLSKGDALAAGQTDYAAFKVDVPQSALIAVKTLTLNYSYTEKTAGATTCVGTAKTSSVFASLPIVSITGDAVTQKTTSVTVPKSTPVWSQIVFSARKAGVDDLKITVSGGPTGLGVTYPGGRSYTQLNDAANLPIGADDYASVKFDATGVPTGTYLLTVTESFGNSTDTNMLTLVVS